MAASRKTKKKRKKTVASEPSRAAPPVLSHEPRYARVPSFFGLKRYEATGRVPQADVLLCGLPFDGGALAGPGARFGPRAVRDASLTMGSYSDALGIDIYDEITVADGGDVPANPIDIDEALGAITNRADAITRSGVVGGYVGGDQTVSLGVLRGIHRAKLKSVGLVHFDAQTDVLGAAGRQDLHHHSVVRHALDEGLVNPEHVLQVGLRGPYRAAGELSYALARGADLVKADEVRWDLHAAVTQIRNATSGAAIYISVDISVLDPSCAPGAGSPRPGGLNAWELQQLLRALVGARIVGFDVVEVAPPYDATGITALAAANVVNELLSVVADTRRSARPARRGRKGRGRRLSP
jgi:agmatinase